MRCGRPKQVTVHYFTCKAFAMANGFAALPWLRRRVKQNIPASIWSSTTTREALPVVLYGLFFFSGWSALVYEISWNRQIGIALGHTATSSAVVLGAYFTGLSLGSWFGGRVADRFAPGRGYAVCELVAALWVIVIPHFVPTIGYIRSTLAENYRLVGTLGECLACILLLSPATIALGATLPFINQWLKCGQHEQTSASRLFRVYAFNTLGALFGVIVSTWMLPTVGVVASSRVAAALAMTCALVAWFVATPGPQTLGQPPKPIAVATLPKTERCWAAVSGIATMALEVLFARLFSLIFHNSTYTFSFVLISFLLGISLGGYAATRLLTATNAVRVRSLATIASCLLIGLSVCGFVGYTQMQYWPPGRSFAAYYASGLAVVVATTLPVAFALSLVLPATWRINRHAHDESSSSSIVGNLTCINTLGGAAGALLANFVLFRVFGLWSAFGFVAALCALPLLGRFGRRWPVALGLITLVVMPFIPRLIKQSSTDTLIARWHSDYGLVDLVENTRTGEKRIQQNLHYRFGGTGANSEREFRQAHLPLLLHPNPRSVLFLGLGTGMTAGGAVPHQSLEKISIVELISEVVEAASLLKEDNQGILQDPRAKVIVDDARHALDRMNDQFDVIVSDLFVPWESETGYLYTVETFQAAHKRLNDGGLFCQWLPLYQMGQSDFEMIADSMRQVFPNVTWWWGRLDGKRPIVALIGSESPIAITPGPLATRISELWAQTDRGDYFLSTPVRLAELYAGDWPLRRDVPLNTDEHPRVEFQAPLAHLNGQTLSGEQLEKFFGQVLTSLSSQGMTYSGETNSSEVRPRAWQQTVLFPSSS